MMRIFENLPADLAQNWGRKPLCLQHNLHTSPLFARTALAALIDAYPRSEYNIIRMGAQEGSDRYWQEGEVNALSGEEVISAIENGRFWLNLRATDEVAPEFKQLIDQMFGEIGEKIGSDDFKLRSLGLLLSSPNAQVYYHCDLPNQSLWQISGRKKVWLYPPLEPFLKDEDLERIAFFESEFELAYRTEFDEHATCFELEPGQMLHWPLNSPHRVSNHNCLNISVTTEYWAEDARRRHQVNVGNGVLRHYLGFSPRGRSTTGASFFAKSLLSSAVTRSGMLRQIRNKKKAVEFALEADAGR